jgi:hypothetical protein
VLQMIFEAHAWYWTTWNSQGCEDGKIRDCVLGGGHAWLVTTWFVVIAAAIMIGAATAMRSSEHPGEAFGGAVIGALAGTFFAAPAVWFLAMPVLPILLDIAIIASPVLLSGYARKELARARLARIEKRRIEIEEHRRLDSLIWGESEAQEGTYSAPPGKKSREPLAL